MAGALNQMEIVPIIGLGLLGIWIYSACSLVYLPVKSFTLWRKKKDLWLFLSRRRLLLSALTYMVSAPLVGLFGFMVSAASASGSHGVGYSDADVAIAEGIAAVFLAAALVALVLVFVRPR